MPIDLFDTDAGDTRRDTNDPFGLWEAITPRQIVALELSSDHMIKIQEVRDRVDNGESWEEALFHTLNVR